MGGEEKKKREIWPDDIFSQALTDSGGVPLPLPTSHAQKGLRASWQEGGEASRHSALSTVRNCIRTVPVQGPRLWGPEIPPKGTRHSAGASTARRVLWSRACVLPTCHSQCAPSVFYGSLLVVMAYNQGRKRKECRGKLDVTRTIVSIFQYHFFSLILCCMCSLYPVMQVTCAQCAGL